MLYTIIQLTVEGNLMDKAERKRRAALAAVALLEWRDTMRRENAERENAAREVQTRYEFMLAQMREQADAPRTASSTPCTLVAAMVHGNGAAGVLS